MVTNSSEATEDVELLRREELIIRNIRTMLKVHHRLRNEASGVDVRIEDNLVVLTGKVASAETCAELVPAIRQAGVLWSISNRVEVDANE